MQKFLTLLVAIAIIYMIFKHNINNINTPTKELTTKESEISKQSGKSTNEEQQNSAQLNGNFVEKAISNVLINVLKTDEGRMFFENILQPVNKPMAGSSQGFKINNDNLIQAMFDIKTFGEGEKGPASCGHLVTIAYKILTPNNMVISEGLRTYHLGSNEIAPGVDAVIVGMKTGQTRNAVISNKYTDHNRTDDKTESFKLSVTLREIVPQNFAGDDVKIFDDEISYKMPLLCGNKAIYHAKITRVSDGIILYNSSSNAGTKLNMHIGNLSYPFIFSHALHNKIPIGTRTVIAKGRLFKSFINDFSFIFPEVKLPENEFFMLELYDFEM